MKLDLQKLVVISLSPQVMDQRTQIPALGTVGLFIASITKAIYIIFFGTVNDIYLWKAFYREDAVVVMMDSVA